MSAAIEELLAIMRRLRDPHSGCAWDLRQDFRSIAPYTIEEAYEVADAIERGDMPDLRDELGDLLLQVVFHARMAEEGGHFAFEDVVKSIVNKMIRRHPHIFAEVEGGAEAQPISRWEEIKAAERAAAGKPRLPIGRRAPASLPALIRASKLIDHARRAGFDWPHWQQVREKLDEELAELDAALAEAAPSLADRHAADGDVVQLNAVEDESGDGDAALRNAIEDELDDGNVSQRDGIKNEWGDGEAAQRNAIEDELGDVLFTLSILCRHVGLDPEAALRRANAKFCRRYEYMEEAVRATGRAPEETDLETLEGYWQEAKREGL